jgi:hypothetical protein
MKYTIEALGRGADCYIYKLSEEQFNKLEKYNGSVDSHDILANELGVEDYFETDLIRSGVYDSIDSSVIIVRNEANEIVWESDKPLEIENSDYEEAFWDGNFIIFEDYGKGCFSEGEFELDGEFDPTKLTRIVSDVCEVMQIISGFAYDGVRIDTLVGDTRSICLQAYVI